MTHKLLSRAGHAGPSVGALCREIHHRDGEVGVRRILGVLSLAKKHGGRKRKLVERYMVEHVTGALVE